MRGTRNEGAQDKTRDGPPWSLGQGPAEAASSIALTLAVLASALDRIALLRAVPADEFAPAIPLFLARPFLRPAATLIVLVGLAWALRARGRATSRALLAAGIAVLATWVPALLLVPVLLWALLHATPPLPGHPAKTAPPEEPDRGRGPVGNTAAALLGLLAALFLDLASLAFLAPRPLLTFSSALFTTARLSLVLLPVALFVAVAATIFERLRARVRPDVRLLLCPLGCGVLAAAFLAYLFFRCLGDEVRTLGLRTEAISGVVLLFTAVRRRASSTTAGHRFAGLGIGALTLASLPPLPEARPGAGRPQLLAASAALALTAISTLVLHPEVEDLRLRIYPAAALAVLLALVALAGLILPRRPRRATFALGLLPVALAGVPLVGPAPETDVRSRILLAEYSRLANADPLGLPCDTELEPQRGAARGVLPVLPKANGPGWSTGGAEALPPVVILLLDAARPDRMGLYGTSRPTTPNLDRFAEGAVVFERAYANATATTLSVRQMLSGTYCSRHMLDTGHPPFFTRELVLAGLRECVITVTGSDYNGVSGEAFQRGFPGATGATRWTFLEFESTDTKDLDPEKCARVIRRWREMAAERPADPLLGTFTFLHLTSPHAPWFNEDPVLHTGDSPSDRYDGEIAKADARAGLVLEALDELDPGRRAVVVVIADHGTGLGEHGRHGGFLPYEEQARIPLLIRVPGLGARRLRMPVSAIDLAPTVLELCGIPDPGRFHGESLVSRMNGTIDGPLSRAIVVQNAFDDGYAIVAPDASLKLHYNRRSGLLSGYDLVRDPGEVFPIAPPDPRLAVLRSSLAEWLRRGEGSFAHPFHYRH